MRKQAQKENSYSLFSLSLRYLLLIVWWGLIAFNVNNFSGNGHLLHPNRVFVDWTANDWVSNLGMDRHFDFDEGTLTVKEPGLYFVYAQVQAQHKAMRLNAQLLLFYHFRYTTLTSMTQVDTLYTKTRSQYCNVRR